MGSTSPLLPSAASKPLLGPLSADDGHWRERLSRGFPQNPVILVSFARPNTRAAGIKARVTAHSGRVGLASELTARGASTTEVMLAGNWKTARMVAHYSAGATAERGAVRKYL